MKYNINGSLQEKQAYHCSDILGIFDFLSPYIGLLFCSMVNNIVFTVCMSYIIGKDTFFIGGESIIHISYHIPWFHNHVKFQNDPHRSHFKHYVIPWSAGVGLWNGKLDILPHAKASSRIFNEK